MKITKKQKPVKKIILALVAVAVLAVGAAAFLTRPSNQTANSQQTSTSNPETAQPVDVNYSPPTEEESQATTQQKQEIAEKEKAAGDSSTPPVATTPDITVTIVRANQRSAGQPLNIRTIIDGTSSGTCSVKLTKSQTTINKTFTVSPDATYALCDQADIPASDFSSAGEWELSVTIQNGSKQSTPATAKVTIAK